MRLWLKDNERRPDPVAVRTDDRLPAVLGIAAWAIALLVLLLLAGPLADRADSWWIFACVAGLVIGAVGLVWASRKPR